MLVIVCQFFSIRLKYSHQAISSHVYVNQSKPHLADEVMFTKDVLQECQIMRYSMTPSPARVGTVHVQNSRKRPFTGKLKKDSDDDHSLGRVHGLHQVFSVKTTVNFQTIPLTVSMTPGCDFIPSAIYDLTGYTTFLVHPAFCRYFL